VAPAFDAGAEADVGPGNGRAAQALRGRVRPGGLEALARVCDRVGPRTRRPPRWLGDRGFDDVVGSIFHHADRTVTRRVYDRGKRLARMVEAMQLWGYHVQSLMPSLEAGPVAPR
jgi:hypothetical protein